MNFPNTASSTGNKTFSQHNATNIIPYRVLSWKSLTLSHPNILFLIFPTDWSLSPPTIIFFFRRQQICSCKQTHFILDHVRWCLFWERYLYFGRLPPIQDNVKLALLWSATLVCSMFQFMTGLGLGVIWLFLNILNCSVS